MRQPASYEDLQRRLENQKRRAEYQRQLRMEHYYKKIRGSWRAISQDPDIRKAVDWALDVVLIAREKRIMQQAQKLLGSKDAMGPLLASIKGTLPGNPTNMTPLQRAVLLEVHMIEGSVKEDVIQRAIENLCKLWGLYEKETPLDPKQEDKELVRDLERLGRETMARVQSSVAVVETGATFDPGTSD